MSSDTLFHSLRTSHGTESLFFFIGTYLFFFPPHMTGLLLASGWLVLAPFFIVAPRPSVAVPGHWFDPWVVFAHPLVPIGALFYLFFAQQLHLSFSFHLSSSHDHASSQSQSIDCIVSASVAVLCEIDCRSSACVVQSDRFKKKRVSVIAGNNLILSLSNLQDHQSPSDDYNHQLPLLSMPSNNILPPLPPPSNDPSFRRRPTIN